MQQVEIRVKGQLAQDWSNWLDGLSIAHVNGDTVLVGWVRDLAALYGLLEKLSSLGLQLLSMAVVETSSQRRGGGDDVKRHT